MKAKGLFAPIGLLSVFLLVAGGITYAITGEMGNLPLALIWVGLLVLLLFFYTYFPEIREFITKRSTKYAFNTAVMSLVFFVIIALIAGMSVKYKMRVDLTKDNRYTLSSHTVKILKALKEDVEAIAFYRGDQRTRQAMSDLLSEYSYHSQKFSFRFVDPDRDPIETAKFEVTSYRTTILKHGDKKEIVEGTESENRLTNSLLKLLSKDIKIFYFVTGHGEKRIDSKEENGYSYVKEAIERENHQVRNLALVNVEKVPEDAAVLVVSGPETDYLQTELDKITAFVKKGGRALFMLDPGGLPKITSYLGSFGFELTNDLVFDKTSQVSGSSIAIPVVVQYDKNHPVTREFEQFTFFPFARSVHIKEEPTKGSFDIAKTSDKSWAVTSDMKKLTREDEEFNPDKHKRGPISVVAVTAVEVNLGDNQASGNKAKDTKTGENMAETEQDSLKTWGKVLVVGDSDFASNKFMKAGNKDFLLNMLNWLAEEHVLISVRRKEPGLTPLLLTPIQGKIVFWLSVVIVPSLLLVAGLGITARRRRGT